MARLKDYVKVCVALASAERTSTRRWVKQGDA